MKSYRFARRSFLASVGGAFGLEILLRNMEASAQGMGGPPPRFLMIHWPVGTIRNQFIPSGMGTSFTTSSQPGPGYILSPFDTPELRPHTIALHGLNMSLRGQGGGHEDGTPFATTGANSPGTRRNGGEPDDGCAGGPSWDQILLKNVPGLSKRNEQGTIIGRGSYNTIADERIDSHELSTRRLSYSYTKQTITASRPANGMISENAPNKPTLAPATTYADLFGSFMPGGTMTDAMAVKTLKLRKSVLDYSTRELTLLSQIAPAQERVKIEVHTQVIRQLEAELAQQIRDAENGGGGGNCTLPPMPDPALIGKTGEGVEGFSPDYGNFKSSTEDATTHEAVGKAHAAILRAAFECDIIRVATFQWSPGTNHVSFKGLDPNSPNTVYMHHPLSHQIGDSAIYNGSRPSTNGYVWDAMVSANRWYFQKTADIVKEFLRPDPQATNGSSASLLDSTLVAMVTEVAEAAHSRNGHAALLLGGRALGMQGGQYRGVSGAHNQLWSTVAQAFLGSSFRSTLQADPGLTAEQYGSNPLQDLWVAPA
jgi:hypothetical protein